MFKKVLMFIICLMLVITAVACGSDNSSGDSGNDGSISNSSAPTGIYGHWVADFDMTDEMKGLIDETFPDAVGFVNKTTVDLCMEFTEDGKYKASIKPGDFYDVFIKCIEDYLKTITNHTDSINQVLDDVRENTTREFVESKLSISEEGTITLTGDPNTSGTVVLEGRKFGGKMTFTVNGDTADLVPTDGDGKEILENKLTLTRE